VSDETPRTPAFTVVSGSPTPEELAVVVTVLSRRGAPAVEDGKLSLWARKSRMTRPSLSPGYGAWRASAMPR